MTLHPVVGHDDLRRQLTRSLHSGGLPQALLLHGLRGVGKQRLALWIGQSQVCQAPRPDTGPCDECGPCRMVLNLEHPDVHWHFPLVRPKGVTGDRLGPALESARHDTLAEIRANPLRPSHSAEVRGIYFAIIQDLRRRAHVRPSMGSMQTFIIADAEFLVPQESSPEAANALLKLLEEPTAGTRFVLTSSEPGRLLPTIRSRTVPLHVSPLPLPTVQEFLESRGGVPAEQARWVAGLSQGSPGRALGFLPVGDDPGPLEAIRREAFSLMEAAISDAAADRYVRASAYTATGGRGMIDLFGFLEEWLRDLAAAASGAHDHVLSRDMLPRLLQMVERSALEPSDIGESLSVLDATRAMARGNVNPQLVVFGLLDRLHRSLRPARLVTSGV
ncbi:MAG: hypothetical protein OEZ65_00865 [Gemmatimonadota bacterium]|nr:hypothetical protein [Gemmatimonadota bacterium]MDH5758106.1 hypothetical protein [Gemmatimonadota bacterium]